MGEQTSNRHDEDEQAGEPEAGESVDSAAEQAKEREREMEESGAENAA